MDTYLRLNTKDEATFQAELAKLEPQQKEKIMQAMTSWEEKGMEKGLEKATQTIALKMLRKNLDLGTIAEFTGLTIVQLQKLQDQL